MIKQDNLKISMKKLSECIDCKVNDIESEWEKWTADDIVVWIFFVFLKKNACVFMNSFFNIIISHIFTL